MGGGEPGLGWDSVRPSFCMVARGCPEVRTDSMRDARHYVKERAASAGTGPVARHRVQDSELATNVVAHARSPFDVTTETLSDNALSVDPPRLERSPWP